MYRACTARGADGFAAPFSCVHACFAWQGVLWWPLQQWVCGMGSVTHNVKGGSASAAVCFVPKRGKMYAIRSQPTVMGAA